MNLVSFAGLLTALLCAGVIVVSLFMGRVPARWPKSSLVRRATPIGFWTMISIYAAGAIMGVLAASIFIG